MAPRRTTLSFSSEDAPTLSTEKIFVYYCKYSGKHALSTTSNLSNAPRRQTDHSLVIDTQKELVKLSNHTSDGGVKFIKRKSGAIERHYRIVLGKLPIAYRIEPEGRYLYILDNALTTNLAEDTAVPGSDMKPPVPPCITSTPTGTRVVLDIYDRGTKNAIIKISADAVRVQIKYNINHSDAMESMMDCLQTIVGVRLSQMEIQRGENPRAKILLIEGVDPGYVFDKMQAAMTKFIKGNRAAGGSGGF